MSSHTRRVLHRMAAPLLLTVTVSACAPDLPEPEAANAKPVQWLDQQWTDADRSKYHYTSQGTQTFPIPYSWFVALEQPKLHLFSDPPLLRDPQLMGQIGFIRGEKTALNPDALPVGFARDTYKDPDTGKTLDMIGLTCAACHTGQINYKGTPIGIDGGAAATNLDALTAYLGLGMAYTKYVPGRFSRFATRVLGPNHTDAQKAELEQQFSAALDGLKKLAEMNATVAKGNVEEGFARLDALNRIGNQVFGVELANVHNMASTNAPVAYPHIWTLSWLNWVQYDASIMQPMVRNAGEALGVSALVNLTQPDRGLYTSSVRLDNLHWMERLLAGPNGPNQGPYQTRTFDGLASPTWPEAVLGRINWDLALGRDRKSGGRALYAQHCAGCHLPDPYDRDGGFWAEKNWTAPNEAGQRYLKVTEVGVVEDSYGHPVGTDPAQAEVLLNRTVTVPEFLKLDPKAPVKDGMQTLGFGPALRDVVQNVNTTWYDQNRMPEAVRREWDGFRPNLIQAKLIYKARPLNGVWATPPFLHNGSVPDLMALLSPVAERPKTFCLGTRDFDPARVGYVSHANASSCPSGMFRLDTSLKGNLNTGHEFNDGKGVGIIGPKLTETERLQIIEYLKSMGLKAPA